jgi:hypothetical protein
MERLPGKRGDPSPYMKNWREYMNARLPGVSTALAAHSQEQNYMEFPRNYMNERLTAAGEPCFPMKSAGNYIDESPPTA